MGEGKIGAAPPHPLTPLDRGCVKHATDSEGRLDRRTTPSRTGAPTAYRSEAPGPDQGRSKGTLGAAKGLPQRSFCLFTPRLHLEPDFEPKSSRVRLTSHITVLSCHEFGVVLITEVSRHAVEHGPETPYNDGVSKSDGVEIARNVW